MPKKRKGIKTVETWGDQHGDSTDYVWFNEIGERKYIPHDSDLKYTKKLKNSGFKRGVQPSNLKAVYQTLCVYIQDKDAIKLAELLKTDFIYPEKLSDKRYSSDASQGEWYNHSEETWEVCPIIESLLIDNLSYFSGLINALIEANNPTLYQAFLDSRTHTALDNEALFLWDQSTRDTISAQLEKMKKYGALLKGKGVYSTYIKGDLAVTVAERLLNRVQERPESSANDMKAKFENLKFRLELVNELHQHDKIFDTHRGLKRIIGNICSFLLTAGLANAINYLATGNVLFFNKTQTQQNILDVQESLGFNKEEPFKPS